MITIRPHDRRGIANFGWLDSRHSFSFGNYFDPDHMGFVSLRVINEDRVTPARGFGTHGHKNMEIISYVLAGELEHRDSMGNGSVIRPGDVQRMSAGTGVRHSEFNASSTNPVHFLQIWVLPEAEGLEPSYEEKNFSSRLTKGQLTLVGSRDGRDNSLTIHQNLNLYLGLAGQGDRLTYQITDSRAIWLQITKGAVLLNDRLLQAGDGAAIIDEPEIVIVGNHADSEMMLFDMANNPDS
ncbi:MAG: pirin family protein [Cyanobacteria bacterium J06623_7]